MSIPSFYKYFSTLKAGITLLFVCFYVVHISAQSLGDKPNSIKWQNKKTKAIAVYGLIKNAEGNLVFIGTSLKKGKDISLMIADTSGQILKDTVIIGGDKDDEANAICNTRDGGFLIAGYTRSAKLQYMGGSDGWVVKTDYNGKPIWEALMGTPGEDVFTSVAEDEKGNFFVTGYSKDALWVVKISYKGEKLWEKRIAGKMRRGKSIAYSKRTGLAVVTGFEKSGRIEHLYITGFNQQGKVVFDRKYENAAGEKIIEMPNGHWLIAGRQLSPKTDQDMLLIQTDSVGVAIQTHTFGGTWDDSAEAMAFDPVSGTVCLAGYTYSHVHYPHKSQLWLIKADLKGTELWNKRAYFGKKDSDEGANDLLLSSEGKLYAVAYTGSERKPWLISFGTVIEPKSDKNGRDLVIEQGFTLTNDSIKTVFKPNERGFYDFVLKNNGVTPIYPLMATVTPTTKTAEGLWVIPKIDIGYLLAGESRHITLPLSIQDSVASDTSHFVVNFFVKDNDLGTSMPFNIVTKAILRPRLKILESVFVTDTSSINAVNEQVKRLILRIKIKNIGKAQAEETQIKFICPPNIKALTKHTVDLGILAKDSTQTASFEYQPEPTFDDSILQIRVSVIEKTREGDTYDDVSVMLKQQKRIPLVPHSPDYSFNTTPLDKQEKQSFLNVYWNQPNVAEIGTTEVEEEKQETTIKIQVQSDKPLADSLVSIYLNGKLFQGSKAKIERIKCLQDDENNYDCIFKKTLLLEKGENIIEAKVKNGAIEKSVQKLKVICNATKPNLYILSLGVPRGDLKFSTKDAEDFASVWQNQKGKLFKEVTVWVRNNKDATLKDSILHTLDFLKKQQIKPQDYLIFYVSTHGFLDDDYKEFHIEAANYSPTTPENSINFGDNVLKKILPIKCKMLVFIDACQSGQAKEIPSKLNDLLLNRGSDFYSILSSDANEYSYEDALWQNSAFTKAITEAFKNQSVETKDGTITANANQDNNLTIEELVAFLRKRVPFIVYKQKARQQTPSLYPKTTEKTTKELEIYKFRP